MYIESIFIAVINTLLNNHEIVNTSLAFIESQIFLPVLISSNKCFSYKSGPVWVRRYNQLQWMYLSVRRITENHTFTENHRKPLGKSYL